MAGGAGAGGAFKMGTPCAHSPLQRGELLRQDSLELLEPCPRDTGRRRAASDRSPAVLPDRALGPPASAPGVSPPEALASQEGGVGRSPGGQRWTRERRRKKVTGERRPFFKGSQLLPGQKDLGDRARHGNQASHPLCPLPVFRPKTGHACACVCDHVPQTPQMVTQIFAVTQSSLGAHPICPQEVPPSARHPPPHPYWAPRAASHPDPGRGPAQQSFPSSPRTAVQKAWGQQKGIPRQDWLLRALLSPSSTPPASPQCGSAPQQGAPHCSAPSFLICTCILPALPSPIVSWPAEWTLSNSGHQSCRIVTSALRLVQGGRMVVGLLCRQPFSLCTSPSLPARPCFLSRFPPAYSQSVLTHNHKPLRPSSGPVSGEMGSRWTMLGREDPTAPPPCTQRAWSPEG